MRKRPKGAKYRNLTARSGVIYYERVVGKKRIKLSTKTDDWNEAAAVRDLYEQKKHIGSAAFHGGDLPTLEEFAQRYLEEDTAHLAPTTRKDRRSYLREDGPLIGFFGRRKLDDISPPQLREWWNQEVTRASRSTRTGRAYLDVLSSVLAYAVDLDILEVNPVPQFRETLRRRAKTQRARAETEAGSDAQETPAARRRGDGGHRKEAEFPPWTGKVSIPRTVPKRGSFNARLANRRHRASREPQRHLGSSCSAAPGGLSSRHGATRARAVSSSPGPRLPNRGRGTLGVRRRQSQD